MSATHVWLGAVAVKLRATKSAAGATPAARFVVTVKRRRCTPASLRWRIRRAMRLREQRTPRSRSSACTRGTPYVSRLSRWISAISVPRRSSSSACADGARSCHAQKPLGETPSTRHSVATGCCTFSRLTNSNPATGSVRSPWRRRRWLLPGSPAPRGARGSRGAACAAPHVPRW